VNVQTDRTLIRSDWKSRRYVLVSFSAPEAPRASTRQPVNIAFVLDRSGSMGGSKIALAKQALVKALHMLRASDRFAVIFYDSRIDVVVPSTPATGEAIATAVRQVEAIEADGNTNLAGGWLSGCEQIARHLDAAQIGTCLLLTDGQANWGITDAAQLETHARELRSRGVATSTLGLGHDFNEDLLQRMADAGGGRSYYIETAVQIGDTLTSELGETLQTVARGAILRVKAPSGVKVDTLNAFEVSRLDELATGIRLGNLVSRQIVSVVVRLAFPPEPNGTTAVAFFSVSDEASVLSFPETDVIWTYASDADNDQQRRNVAVDREVARLYAAKAREEALELNRAGEFERAQRRLNATADRIRHYAGKDPALGEILSELADRQVMYARHLSTNALKGEHYAHYYLSHMRQADGKARRSPDAS
jgi:Ca-activated chloride channel homolog